MNIHSEPSPAALNQIDYEYGNRSSIEVVRLLPFVGGTAIDPHASLELGSEATPLFSEAELEATVREIAENYHIIHDPKSIEARPKQFGVTVVNSHALEAGVPGILIMSSMGSSLYDEQGHPNNEGNALEIAYTARKYAGRPIFYAESPGNGNSSDLTADEYKEAANNGRLLHVVTDASGHISGYEGFETMQALARAMQADGINISHISTNANAGHFATALMPLLPEDSMQRAFLYNLSNISDTNWLALTVGNLKEIAAQGKYARVSKDPLQLTAERKEMARRVMGEIPKRRLDQARASTHNPIKMWRQQKIFRRGNQHGQSAAVQVAASQLRHNGLKQTVVFPEYAAQYRRPEDLNEFSGLVEKLGGTAVTSVNVESLKIPLGQYGHSHYPTARQTLESYGFSR